MLKKIAIVHFQPVELYPPVMNTINELLKLENINITIYTSNNKKANWFKISSNKIYRFSKQYEKSLLRYWGYINFNLGVFIKILLSQPKVIIAFETYSLFPVYLYKSIFKKTKIIIHYHEYESLNEKALSSSYSKFLHLVEKKLFLNCEYISQTNAERLHLFLIDNPTINKEKTLTTPNLPPSNWYGFSQLNKKRNDSKIVKLIHVGAISLETMYIEKVVNWVIKQNGTYLLDFYTNNITYEARLFFDKIEGNNFIRLFGEINYFDLPKVLLDYDIGITLYNGHIPNYIYNVPNKVLEYLACGLNVWYSSDLISTINFVNENSIKGCTKINFNELELMKTIDYSFNLNPNYKNLLTKEHKFLSTIANFAV